eukprot:Protomagalhaensia_wolfi_Nauph_80__2354@NODE_2546_length_1058_cov_13_818449_g1993_i0_p1_GENE_NODE_2546_length_1058_cov_13_818449_g1993_i0NODE_2546_length_1058_cov_13_818449_g1993_i0_p1_ORF_typecomplete_len180_score30_05PUD1_2/PF18457_1/2e46_NODE_2546_length_1058_cov_13_818449_g1993_i040579
MVTKRIAYAIIRNNTGAPIYGAGLVHKYSDVYRETDTWEVIEDGDSSPPLLVEYHTGFMTTGVDWWVVSWHDVDFTRQYFSSPNNFREVFDFLESAAVECIPVVVGQAKSQMAFTFSRNLCNKLMNTEATAGFKRHMLTSEDDGGTVEITINSDLTITIQSPSGVSETVSDSRTIPDQA